MLPAHGSSDGPASQDQASGLDTRRKRALIRAWRRGTREMDLVMGRFADQELARLSEAELGEFERLLEETEADVFAWVTNRASPPEAFDTPLLARLRTYRG